MTITSITLITAITNNKFQKILFSCAVFQRCIAAR